jgi:hypothetical protein
MTKLDLVLARIRKLPPEQQEAIAAEIDLRLDHEAGGSAFSDEEWAQIEATMDNDGTTIPHEQIVAEVRAKFPG